MKKTAVVGPVVAALSAWAAGRELLEARVRRALNATPMMYQPYLIAPALLPVVPRMAFAESDFLAIVTFFRGLMVGSPRAATLELGQERRPRLSLARRRVLLRQVIALARGKEASNAIIVRREDCPPCTSGLDVNCNSHDLPDFSVYTTLTPAGGRGQGEGGHGVLSVQVLQEFYINATRKLKKLLTSAKALEIVNEYLTWTIVDNTGALLTSAISLQQRTRLSFWDSLIVQAAIEGGCNRLYSEDLRSGQKFQNVVVVNPFARP